MASYLITVTLVVMKMRCISNSDDTCIGDEFRDNICSDDGDGRNTGNSDHGSGNDTTDNYDGIDKLRSLAIVLVMVKTMVIVFIK